MAGPAASRAVCALVIAALLPLAGAIDLADPAFAGWDAHRYLAMARAAPGFAAVRQPECRRLLGPWLAAIAGFQPVAWAALACCAALLFVYLRHEGISERGAAIGVILFGLARHLFGFIAWDAYQANDAIGLAALLGALIAARAGRWAVFALVLAIGATARETALLAVPAAIAIDRRALGWSLPALAVSAALHVGVPCAGGLSLLDSLAQHAPAKLAPAALARALSAFAPLTLIPLVARRSLRGLRADHALLLLGTFAASLFGSDVERLMLTAAPVVYLVIARAADAWPAWAQRALLAIAFVGSLHHQIGRFPLPSRALTIALTLASTIAATLLAILAERDPRVRHGDPDETQRRKDAKAQT